MSDITLSVNGFNANAQVSFAGGTGELAKAYEAYGRLGMGVNPEFAAGIFAQHYQKGNCDPLLVCRLGECLILGIGMAQDLPRGVELLKRSLDAGCAEAALHLAECALMGIGGSADAKAAEEFLKKGMELGSLEAKVRLAGLLFERQGKDDLYARELFRECAAAGSAAAAFALGALFYFGIGTPSDDSQARHYLSQSAQAGIPAARILLAGLLFYGRGGAKESAAARQLLSGAETGNRIIDGISHTLKGNLESEENHEERAVSFWAEGARCGNGEALRQLGMAFLKGRGVPRDPRSGVLLLEESYRNAPDPETAVEIAECCLKGTGMVRDCSRGYDLLNSLKDQSSPRVQFLLGCACYCGMGTAPDEVRGLELLKRAAAAGYEPAAEYLKRI